MAAAHENSGTKRERQDSATAEQSTDAKRAAGASTTAPSAFVGQQVKTCEHYVGLPQHMQNADTSPDDEGLYNPSFAGDPAKTWPFTLDPFQSKSIAVLERRESVMVAAHTSAGKTVVAEYATAMAIRDQQRSIYTSPLKALSNQKYRELNDQFGDVGLMTGDVTLNPNAACIVMTTEVLRSMLYRGSEAVREVGWVIFDEVHYMRDRERGVVWEESIVLISSLLPGARMVFLSATLSNANEFAEWVANLTRTPCHVVSTDHRPTPLKHYAFPKGSQGIHLVCDGRTFKPENFARARRSFEEAAASGRGGQGRKGDGNKRIGDGKEGSAKGVAKGGGKDDTSNDVFKIVKMCKDKSLFPVIVFSFARRETEGNCSMCSKLDFNDEEESAHVEQIFEAAIQNLPKGDQGLPAIRGMLPMLKKGVAVHHSGLLPILKELVELLFQEHLIKALFATETFAMGLNMPAKAVVFTQLSKWDGEQHRVMSPGEYIQMSGRAGRRGMDEFGLSIIMIDQDVEAAACQEMMMGKPSPLMSTFHLSYYTLLNLMRRSEGTLDMEFVIEKSFLQYQHTKKLPLLDAEIARLEKEAALIVIPDEPSAQQHQALYEEAAVLRSEVLRAQLQPEACLHMLRTGRVVRVESGGKDWGWGTVIKAYRTVDPPPVEGAASRSTANLDILSLYRLDVLMCVLPSPRAADGGRMCLPAPLAPGGRVPAGAEAVVVPCPLAHVAALSACRLTLPSDLRSPDRMLSVVMALQELITRHPDGLPLLDPVKDMGISDAGFLQKLERLKQLEATLGRSNGQVGTSSSITEAQIKLFEKKAMLLSQIKEKAQEKVSGSLVRQFNQELKNRSKVLKRLGHISEDGAQVLLKGRAACEVDTADELLVTELMFNNAFSSLTVPQLVAVMSCFMQVEKSQDQVHLKEILAAPLCMLRETARMIGEIQLENKVEIVVDDYVDSFQPTLMDIVFKWCNGVSFLEISSQTDLFEGSIIRAMRRLSELVSQLALAAGVVGNEELKIKANQGVEALTKGIVFAASLYVSD